MTAHDPDLQRPDPAPHFVAAERLVRPLLWLTAMTVIAAAGMLVLFGRGALPWLPFARPIVRPLGIAGPPGMAGLATGALLLAALGLIDCLRMTLARRRYLNAMHSSASSARSRRVSGWPQTGLTLLFTMAVAGAVLADWPSPQPAATVAGFTTASALLVLATPWLLAERFVATVSVAQLPERDDLRALLFLPVVLFVALAILQVVASVGFGTLYWPHAILSVVLLLVCAELCLRVLATWFLPPNDRAAAKAIITSFVAGLLRGRSLSPAALADNVRSRFGMDFSRSWALRFMRATAVPVGLLMLALCWFLTGVTRVELNQRGSYERFGVANQLLQPGLHLGLPWPFGVVRHLELGVVHAALVSYGDQPGATDALDTASAEGDAPTSANRLWDKEQPSDMSYVIASQEQDRQSFQTVSVSVRVLYRIGLNDASARAALYREADPDALVHALAGRLLAQFFASQTLPQVLGEDQGVIASGLQTRLQQALNNVGSGIDVVAVIIEAIHPPSGAASAYRNVQAAEIAATASIAAERGRAQTTKSVASLNAHNATDDAAAAAAETIGAAQVDLINIAADDHPYHAAAQPFLLERYFADIQAALTNVPLQIIDHRLTDAASPTIDLRPPGAVHDGADTRAARGAARGDQTP